MNLLFLSKILRLMEFLSMTGFPLNQHRTSERKLSFGVISKFERAVEGGSGEKPEMGALTGLVDSGAGYRKQIHG